MAPQQIWGEDLESLGLRLQQTEAQIIDITEQTGTTRLELQQMFSNDKFHDEIHEEMSEQLEQLSAKDKKHTQAVADLRRDVDRAASRCITVNPLANGNGVVKRNKASHLRHRIDATNARLEDLVCLVNKNSAWTDVILEDLISECRTIQGRLGMYEMPAWQDREDGKPGEDCDNLERKTLLSNSPSWFIDC